jgi:hypothetical protein
MDKGNALNHRRKVRTGIGALLQPIALNMSAKLWRLDDVLLLHALTLGGIMLSRHATVGGLETMPQTTAPCNNGDHGESRRPPGHHHLQGARK